LFVDRAFTIRGSGTVVTGTLSGGCLTRGASVELQPQNRSTRVRVLQSHNQTVETAQPATRTALNLPDLQPDEVPRGTVLTTVQPARASHMLDVLLFRSARSTARPLKNAALLQFHYGSARLLVRATLLDRRELVAGESAIARLHCAEPVFAFLGDRFILRDASARETVAGGLILDPNADQHKFRSRSQRDLLKARAAAPNELPVLLRTELQRDKFARRDFLLVQSGFSQKEIAEAVDELIRRSELVQRGEIVTDVAWWRELVRRAAQLIDATHAAHPNETGLALPQLRTALALPDADVFDSLIAQLCEQDFARAANAIRRRTHRPSLPAALQRAGAEIRAALAARPFDPPSRKELAATAAAQEALRFLCESEEVLRLGEEVVVSAVAFAEMKQRVSAVLRARGAATTSEIRQALGTTRRVLVPLLEYFDRIGLTIREGDRRKLRIRRA
jgi:selenocysteine-specific elongation factor